MTAKRRLTEELDICLRLSEPIPGWTRGEEARELLRISHSLSADAVIVEIGSFFGAGAILLAGPRRIRGSGLVHCVDPFDGTGDIFSVPHYRRILAEFGSGSLRDHFERNIHEAGLGPWVRLHQGRADEVARSWTTVPSPALRERGDPARRAIDLLYL